MRDFKEYGHNSGNGSGWGRDLLFLLLILGIPFLQFLGGLPLIDPDEGRYAEIPREMLERGDWITPTLNYVKYFEKPPLLYWANAISLKLFGLNEFAARLPSALAGLMTVLATYLVALRLYGRRTALLAAAILGTSAGFVLQSRIILTDMLLTFWLTAALGSFIVAAQRETRREPSRLWHLFYFSCAMAVLTKGLIGMVFPGGIAFFYLLCTGRWRLLGRMRLASGLALFLAVTVPWFVAVSLRNPEFARFFFIHEHFERFTSKVHGRYQPFWFFVPVLAATMLPWSFFIPGAIGKALRERRHEGGTAGLFLLIWTFLIFLFFSKSSSKLIPYILPIFPPLAILVAHRLRGILEGRGRSAGTALVLLGGIQLVLGAAALGYARLPQVAALLGGKMPSLAAPLERFVSTAPPITTAACLTVGLLFLLQGVTVLTTSRRKPVIVLAVLIIGSFLLEIVVPRMIMGGIAASESPRELALKAKSAATADTALVTFGPMQAVSWYLSKRVLVTDKPDELEFGSKQGDQSAWFLDRQALLRLWQGDKHLLVFLKKRELDSLQPDLVPAPRTIAVSGRRLLISNR